MKFLITLTFLLLTTTLSIHLKRKEVFKDVSLTPFTIHEITIDSKETTKCLDSFASDPMFKNKKAASLLEPSYGTEFTKKKGVECSDLVKKYFIENKDGKYVLPFEFIREVEPAQDQNKSDYEFAEMYLSTAKNETKVLLKITFAYGIGKYSRDRLLAVIDTVIKKRDKQYMETQAAIHGLVKDYNPLVKKESLSSLDVEQLQAQKIKMTNENSVLEQELKEKEGKIAELKKKIESVTKERKEVLKEEEISISKIKTSKEALAQLQLDKIDKEKVQVVLDNLKPFLTEDRMKQLKTKAVQLIDNGKDQEDVIRLVEFIKDHNIN